MKISQRKLARLASLSFRTIQQIESGRHNPTLLSLEKISSTLGYSKNSFLRVADDFFGQPVDSIKNISQRIQENGKDSWRIFLFNFVDAFRRDRNKEYIQFPPSEKLSIQLRALISSVTETLCDEIKLPPPWWTKAYYPLKHPWFVSGIENLKACALMESPIHFRKRNIFVLENFLDRL